MSSSVKGLITTSEITGFKKGEKVSNKEAVDNSKTPNVGGGS